jgi:hypothetical protein
MRMARLLVWISVADFTDFLTLSCTDTVRFGIDALLLPAVIRVILVADVVGFFATSVFSNFKSLLYGRLSSVSIVCLYAYCQVLAQELGKSNWNVDP